MQKRDIYAEMEPEVATDAKISADYINDRGKNIAENVVKIGKQLNSMKESIPHGLWLRWVENETFISVSTAQTYMNIAIKNPIIGNLEVGLTVLGMISAPSYPEEASKEIADRSRAGEHITVDDAREANESEQGVVENATDDKKDWNYQPSEAMKAIGNAIINAVEAPPRPAPVPPKPPDDTKPPKPSSPPESTESRHVGGEIVEFPSQNIIPIETYEYNADALQLICPDCGSVNDSVRFRAVAPDAWQPAWIQLLKSPEEGVYASHRVKWKPEWEGAIYRHFDGEIDDSTAMTIARALVSHDKKYRNYALTFINWYEKELERKPTVPAREQKYSGRTGRRY